MVLADIEIHTGWMMRRYLEQERIPDFEKLSSEDRKKAVKIERDKDLIRIAGLKTEKQLREAKKNYKKTELYAHLTRSERIEFLKELCDLIGAWGESRLFAYAIYKEALKGRSHRFTPYEHAFFQVLWKFERFLRDESTGKMGLLVHDNNETVSKRITEMMYAFHKHGTLFGKIQKIIETPLFVDSSLTGMVQIADLCAYAIRRFCENGETELFNRIHPRVHRKGFKVLGLTHYTGKKSSCSCKICQP